jgi:hypothetical protein
VKLLIARHGIGRLGSLRFGRFDGDCFGVGIEFNEALIGLDELAAFEKDIGDDARRSGRHRHLLTRASGAYGGDTFIYSIDFDDGERDDVRAVTVITGALCLSIRMAETNRNKKERKREARGSESYPPAG